MKTFQVMICNCSILMARFHLKLFSNQTKYPAEYSPNTSASHSIVDIRTGLLDHSLSTSSNLSSWEFVMGFQSIIPDFWRTILIHFLCHRNFSPCFCCTGEALHQIAWIHTRSSSIYIHVSLSNIPQNLEVALHMLLLQLLCWEEHYLHPSDLNSNP